MTNRRENRCARSRTFEQLENRRLLAGNVSVAVRDGHLYVTGDNLANGVEIVGTAVANEYQIIGFDPGTGPTTVTGPSTVRDIFGIEVSLLGGDDSVLIHKVETRSFVRVLPGAGNDSVQIGGSGIARGTTNIGVSLEIFDHDSGRNTIDVIGATVRNNAWIDVTNPVAPSTLRDRIQMYSIGGTRVQVGGYLIVSGAQDNYVMGVDVGNDFYLDTDARQTADDNINAYYVSVRGQLWVYTYAGNDRVGLYHISASDMVVRTSDLTDRTTVADNDTMTIDDFRGRALSIFTGGGWDGVYLRNSVVDDFYADLGAGYDVIELASNRISHLAELEGGTDANYLTLRDNTIASLTTTHFERPRP